MKYYLFSLIFLSITSTSLSQIKESNLEKEVIIVLYNDFKNKHTKKRFSNKLKNIEKQSYWYFYYFNEIDRIELLYKEYQDFDKQHYDQPMLFFKVNKSFLRKNKQDILTREKMLELGYNKTFEIFYKAKHILLIDKNEIKDGKLTIKEVIFANAIEE